MWRSERKANLVVVGAAWELFVLVDMAFDVVDDICLLNEVVAIVVRSCSRMKVMSRSIRSGRRRDGDGIVLDVDTCIKNVNRVILGDPGVFVRVVNVDSFPELR